MKKIEFMREYIRYLSIFVVIWIDSTWKKIDPNQLSLCFLIHLNDIAIVQKQNPPRPIHSPFPLNSKNLELANLNTSWNKQKQNDKKTKHNLPQPSFPQVSERLSGFTNMLCYVLISIT